MNALFASSACHKERDETDPKLISLLHNVHILGQFVQRHPVFRYTCKTATKLRPDFELALFQLFPDVSGDQVDSY
jgi:hypothetical protein